MQSLLDWLNLIDWGQYDFIKYIIVAVLVIALFDILYSLVYSLISSSFRLGRNR